MTDVKWWDVHENLVTLTAYMADNGYDAKALAYAIEKPWKHEDIWIEASAGQ